MDDHPVIAAGLLAALADLGDFAVAGVASTIAGAVALVDTARPDVILCDIHLGPERGLDLPPRLTPPPPPIIFFTSYDYPSYVRAALDGGVAGYVLKSAPLGEVAAAIRTVAEGGTAYASRHLRNARTAPRIPSGRELEVISRVARGSSNSEIGVALKIDERTVESHLRRLFDRYSTDSRTELSTYCVRQGWIDLNSMETGEDKA
ncbi:MAG TPA: response regulator transcription factor [Candidatus Limnocylindrales bacterium]